MPAETSGELKNAIDDLSNVVHAFKEDNDKRIADLEKGKGDVIQDEKVDRQNAEITKLQEQVAALSTEKAAASVGEGDVTNSESYKAYVADYDAYMRYGDKDAERRIMNATRGKDVYAGLSITVSEDGGLTAPTEWDRTVTGVLTSRSDLRSICNVKVRGKASFQKLYNLHGADSGWALEKAPRPQTNTPTLQEKAYTCFELYANPAITQTALEDSEIDIAKWLSEEVEDSFADQENAAFIRGNGTTQPEGIMTATSGFHPLGDVDVVTSGVADNIATDTLVDLVYGLHSKNRKNAHFIMNNLTMAKIRKMKNEEGDYLWQPSLALGQPATLLGYPVTEVEELDQVEADKMPIAFGNFKRAYTIVDKRGLFILRDPFTNKPYVNFYTTKRVGGFISHPKAMIYYKIAA